MKSQSIRPLYRKLGLFSVFAIIVADMIGTGIFTTSGLAMEQVKSPYLMVALWVAGGFVALAGALCYAELSTAMPFAGGEYIYLSRLFHPSLGFLSGWISFIVGFSAPLAAVAIGMSEYIVQAFPGLTTPGEVLGFQSDLFFQKFLAISVIVIFTLIHLQGVKTGSRIHNGLTWLKIILILGLLIVGFSSGEGSFQHFQLSAGSSLSFTTIKPIGLSVIWIMFAYSGWNAAAYIGSEVRNPSRNLPRALILGTAVVLVVYLLINILFVYALPPSEMDGVIAIGGKAVKALFSPAFGRVFSGIIALILFSTISSLIFLGPRVYYAMAGEGHFFRFASRVNSKGVPALSILIQAALAVIIALVGAFDQILTYMGLSLSIFPLLAVVGVFKLHRSRAVVYRSPLYPVMPVFFITTSVLMIFLSISERPVESSFALGTLLIGIPLYVLFKRKRK